MGYKMRHPRRESTKVNQRLESAYSESAKVLDERMVLEQLETDLDNDDDRKRIVGIAYGLVFGAVLWIVLLTTAVTAVVIAL